MGSGPGEDQRRLDSTSSLVSGCLDQNPDHGSVGRTDFVETFILSPWRREFFPPVEELITL